MASISLCMIVKDEAETLEAAILSVKDHVDEVVIGVDDACSDDTPSIAQKYADVYFEFTWGENFAEARNQAIAKCTSELILVLDGHEFVAPDSHPIAQQIARMRGIDVSQTQLLTPLSFIDVVRQQGIDPAFDVLCVTLAMNVDEIGVPQLFFLQPRIFRNDGKICYTAAVHNHLTNYRKEGAVGCAECIIIHNMPPKREERRKKQRAKMNVSGLVQQWRENKADGRPLFYLGNTYADAGNPQKAIYWYERYLSQSQFTEEKYQALQQLSVLYLRHRDDVGKSTEYALQAMALNHRRAEPLIVLAEIAEKEEDWAKAIHYYGLAEMIPAPDTVMFLQGTVYSYMTFYKRMLCYEKQGNWAEAIRFATETLAWRQGDPHIVERLESYKDKLRGDKKQDRNLLLVDKLQSFTGDLAAALGQRGFTVACRTGCDARWQGWADLAWFEWCDENIVRWSYQDFRGPVVCRLHSYEAFGDMPGHVQWNKVDCLIFVAEHIRDMAITKWPQIAEQTRVEVIPNGVKSEGLTYRQRSPGRKIGFLGYLNHKKGVDAFMQVIQSLPDYEFHIAGKFQDPHLADFAQTVFEEQHNVTYYGWVEPERKDEWLENVDFLISPSIVESFGYSIAEAMLKGIKPLIRYRKGAIWPETWRTIEDLRTMLEGPYESEAYRQHIHDNYSLESQIEQTHTLLEELLAGSSVPVVEKPYRLSPVEHLQLANY